HRPPAGHAEADGRAENPGLGQRRVDASLGAELVPQPRRRAEHSAGAADILAHHHHVGIAPQLDVERVAARLDERPPPPPPPPPARPARTRATAAATHTRARKRARCRPAAPPRPPRSPHAGPPTLRHAWIPRARRSGRPRGASKRRSGLG